MTRARRGRQPRPGRSARHVRIHRLRDHEPLTNTAGHRAVLTAAGRAGGYSPQLWITAMVTRTKKGTIMPDLWLRTRTQQGTTLLRTDRITEVTATPTALSVRTAEQPEASYAVLEDHDGATPIEDGAWARELLAAFREAGRALRDTGGDHEVWPIVQDGEVGWQVRPIGSDVATQRAWAPRFASAKPGSR